MIIAILAHGGGLEFLFALVQAAEAVGFLGVTLMSAAGAGLAYLLLAVTARYVGVKSLLSTLLAAGLEGALAVAANGVMGIALALRFVSEAISSQSSEFIVADIIVAAAAVHALLLLAVRLWWTKLGMSDRERLLRKLVALTLALCGIAASAIQVYTWFVASMVGLGIRTAMR